MTASTAKMPPDAAPTLLTPEERAALVAKAYGRAKRHSKFHAERCVAHAGRHASLKECRRSVELATLERLGAVRDLREQVRVPLCDHADNPLVWVADFVYWERCPDEGPDTWREIHEDVKGGKATQTAVFRLKRHLLADRGIEVRIT